MEDRKQPATPKKARSARMQDLSGRRFGILTVLEYMPAEKKWKCQCDCGNLTYKTASHLNAGVSSCGCLRKKDLTGKRFGKLVVLEKTEEKCGTSWLWRCRCDCGTVCVKPTNRLNAGWVTSCGCAWRPSPVQAGDRFGRLTAIRPTDQRGAGSVIWECRCDCGSTVAARANMLASGHTTSCGCIKKELDKERDFKKILTYANNTYLEFAENIAKPRANTSADTGVRGVVMRRGKYIAHIKFQKKRHYLGTFSQLEEAVKARREAEARVAEYLEEYLAGNPEPVFKLP